MDKMQEAMNILIDGCDRECHNCSIFIQCEELVNNYNFYCDVEPINLEFTE